MKLTAHIENVYPDDTVDSTVEVDVAPPSEYDGDRQEWAEEELFPLTGTGRTEGDAGYFVKIVACEDESLVGAEFEWGI